MCEQLNLIRDAVNDMSKKWCRLANIHSALAQQTVDCIAVEVPLIVDAIDEAINFGDASPHTLWNPTYQKCVAGVSQESESLNRSLENAVLYSSVLHRYREPRNSPGLKDSS
jgi:hypothetical protein